MFWKYGFLAWCLTVVAVVVLDTPSSPSHPMPDFAIRFNPGLLAIDDVGHELFRLEEGGCLRGALKIFGSDGATVFSLAEGAWYPAGCNK